MERAFWLMGFTSGARQRSEMVSIMIPVEISSQHRVQLLYPRPRSVRWEYGAERLKQIQLVDSRTTALWIELYVYGAQASDLTQRFQHLREIE